MESTAELIQRAAEKFGNRTFLYFKNRTISFRQMDEVSDNLASAFLRLGLKKGDRVAVMLMNRPEYLHLWFGLNKIGASMVPINVDFTVYETQYLLDHSESVMAITDSAHFDIVDLARKDCPGIQSMIVLDTPSAPPGCVLFSDLLRHGQAPQETPTISCDDEAAVLYTSGTTGRPKGCLVNQYYYLNLGAMYVREHMVGDKDVILTPLPLFHMNAQTLTIMGALTAGASVVLVDRFHPSTWWQDIRKHQVTFFHYLGVIPAMLMGLAESEYDYGGKTVYGIGAGVPKDIQEKFEKRFNVALLEVYGSTEGGGGGLFLTGRRLKERKPGTAAFGKLLPEVEARIVDDNDRSVPDGTVGELLTRSSDEIFRRKGFMSGYLKDQDATAEVWRNGWFHTGDYCYRDEDGYYHFVDRKKDMIRRSGENISASEVESVLSDHPDVLDAAVIAVPDSIRIEEVKAYVVPCEGVSLPPEHLIQWCEQRLAYYKIPRFIEFRDSLPKTATQKIQKNVLKSEVEDLIAHSWDRTRHMKLHREKRR